MTAPPAGKWNDSFRTVRERFLSGVQDGLTLDELNQAFWLWLQDDYHHKLHTGIDERPIDRYNASVGQNRIRRLSKSRTR